MQPLSVHDPHHVFVHVKMVECVAKMTEVIWCAIVYPISLATIANDRRVVRSVQVVDHSRLSLYQLWLLHWFCWQQLVCGTSYENVRCKYHSAISISHFIYT